MNYAISICLLYSLCFKHTFQNYIIPADFILLEALTDAKKHFKQTSSVELGSSSAPF